jgi:hypothetical protein
MKQRGKEIGIRTKEVRTEVRPPVGHGVDESCAPVAQAAPVEPEWEELGYTRLFLERVRIPLIAESLSNTLCVKSKESERRGR